MFQQMHYDDAYGTYLDFGNHTEKVSCLLVINIIPFFFSSVMFSQALIAHSTWVPHDSS